MKKEKEGINTEDTESGHKGHGDLFSIRETRSHLDYLAVLTP